MKIKATIAVLFLTAFAGSSVAHANDPSQEGVQDGAKEGACYVTNAYGTTCFIATSDVCETHISRDYGVTVQWVTGTCGGENQ
jgi:hypothetical protein